MVTENGIMIELADGEAHVIGYRGEDPEVLIPEEAFGCPVTTIASGAFVSSPISYIVFPPTLTHIQPDSFTNCADLSYILYGSVENPLHCEDEFIGCDKLMLIQVFTADVWQGNVPESAFLLWSQMETPAGVLEDFEFLEDGCLYGWTEDGNVALLKAPSDVTDLVMADDCEDYLVYIMDGALGGAHDLETITLTDQVYYSLTTAELLFDLPEVTINFNSPSFSWYNACAGALNANEYYGKDVMQPNMDLCQIAHDRAVELAEDFTEQRPDGSEWTTILKDFGCTYCRQQGGRNSDDEKLLNALGEHLTSFTENGYDENGNPYTEVGFGITMKDDVYYYIFFYTNND